MLRPLIQNITKYPKIMEKIFSLVFGKGIAELIGSVNNNEADRQTFL